MSEDLLSLKLTPSARLSLVRSQFHIPTGARTFGIVLNEVATAWVSFLLAGRQGGGRAVASFSLAKSWQQRCRHGLGWVWS